MKKIKLLLMCTCLLILQTGFSQEKKCCDDPACKQRAIELAARISGPAKFIKSSKTAAGNQHTLDSLQIANPAFYDNFIKTMADLVVFMNDHKQDLCFADQLPEDVSDNVFDWLIFFNDKEHPVKFPSSEFCNGWKKRFEINQGAANIFKKSMTYFASLRGYFIYTFAKKNSCGGIARLMAGPAGFIRGNLSYLTLSTRAAFRIKDIAPKNFSLGNINLFGEYNSNFKNFNYAAAGLEVELGSFGLNFSGNFDTDTHAAGFLVGLVFSNKKLKK
ncbi:MAG: hypothetical protein ABJA78_12990 [Ferruginibacter sp.]